MKNLDQWILVVIACIAVIAPCITTYLNNRHQYKIALLNTRFQRNMNYIDNYFDAVSKFIYHNGPFNNENPAYKSALQKLYIIANEESRNILNDIDLVLMNPNNWSPTTKLNEIIQPKLNELSKNINKCL